MNDEEGIATIKRSLEQQIQLVISDRLLQGIKLGLHLPVALCVALLFCQLDQDGEIFHARIKLTQGRELALDDIGTLDDFFGGILAIPETGIRHFMLQSRQLFSESRDVKDTSGVRSGGL